MNKVLQGKCTFCTMDLPQPGPNGPQQFYVAICNHFFCEPCFLANWIDEEVHVLCAGCQEAPKPSDVKLMKNHFGLGVASEVNNMKEVDDAFKLRRRDFPTLDDYNTYLEKKLDLAFRNKERDDTVMQEIENFKRANAGVDYEMEEETEVRQLQDYIIEEFLRISRRRLKREKLTDDWSRDVISGALLVEGFKAIEEEERRNSHQRPKAHTEILALRTHSEPSATASKPQASLGYTPGIEASMSRNNINVGNQFPKPLVQGLTLEKARAEKKKLTAEQKVEAKRGGGVQPNSYVKRLEKLTFDWF